MAQDLLSSYIEENETVSQQKRWGKGETSLPLLFAYEDTSFDMCVVTGPGNDCLHAINYRNLAGRPQLPL